MNLVLLAPGDLAQDGTARLTGRRARHVREVLKPAPGDLLRAGLEGGAMGTARVLAVGADEVVLSPALDRSPPARAPLDLVVALPRPKILRKVLQAAASLGVGRVVVLETWRVEKSYWSSPLLEPAALAAELRLGLEQGCDTIAPEVLIRRRFKPFVEDELEALTAGQARLLAHPAADRPLAALTPAGARAVVAVGPERGFTPYELAALEARGFAPFTLGARVLRVDVAVPAVAGAVAAWLALTPAAPRRP